MDIIEQAKDILYPFAKKYECMNYIYVPSIKDEEDDETGEEDGSCEEFCKNCIDEKVNKIKESKEYPDKFIDYELYDISCSESDGFRQCESCGVVFNYSLILDNQELDHWENNCTNEDFIFNDLLNENQIYLSFQLDKILDEISSKSDINKRVNNLAEKIVILNKKEV